jgi:hypothetical protein
VAAISPRDEIHEAAARRRERAQRGQLVQPPGHRQR